MKDYDHNSLRYKSIDFQIHATDFVEIQHKIEKEKKYVEALIELKELSKRNFFGTRERQGGLKYFMGVCLENTNAFDQAYSCYFESAEIRKEFKGLRDEHTQKSIDSLVRIAKKIDKMDLLPKWIENLNK
jgi:hypothetical protein